MITGWDIGGANIKASQIGVAEGAVAPRIIARPFALWREPGRLPCILADVAEALGPSDVMAVTMTAELADCFATKREGVRFVLDAVESAFPGASVHVYGTGGFLSLEAARAEPLRVAASNWMALASWVARHYPDALLIDVGSTTTDIVPIIAGVVAAEGRTDTERLTLGELVYTGLLRTPLCALVRRVPIHGRQCRVAAEHFAIAADAHVWLGRIEPRSYACDTPDGCGTSRRDAGRRLARMVCGDEDSLADADVTVIARAAVDAQRRLIGGALAGVRARLGDRAPGTAVTAGSGGQLAAEVAHDADIEVVALADHLGDEVALAAPAAAVAYLAADSLLKPIDRWSDRWNDCPR